MTNKPALLDRHADHPVPQYDIDSDRPHPSGLDDNFRPSVDQESKILFIYFQF